MSDLIKKLFWVVSLLAIGVLGRWVAHAPNFTPTLAIALFAGIVLPPSWALIVPIASLFLSDLFLGFHDLVAVVYLTLLPLVWLGMKAGTGSLRMGAGALLASVFFFAVTNFAVWWSSGIYPHTFEGLSFCFTLALPFFTNTLLSTLTYLTGFELVRRLSCREFSLSFQ